MCEISVTIININIIACTVNLLYKEWKFRRIALRISRYSLNPTCTLSLSPNPN